MRAADLASFLRPFTWIAPALGVLCGAGAAAAALGETWARPALIFAAAAAVAASIASNAWNQVFDLEIDRINKPARPLPAGRMRVTTARAIGHAAALVALGSSVLVGVVFTLCVGAGLAATWAYSAPPLRWKRHTVGALLTIAVPRGLLVPVAGWSVVGSVDRADPWALGVVAGLFVFGAAATKDFADVPGDRAHGCRTLPVRIGAVGAARVVAPFLVLPFFLYPVFGWAGWIAAPTARLLALAVLLGMGGVGTARALLADPEGRAHVQSGHPAWRGMYLLLIGMQVGAVLLYV